MDDEQQRVDDLMGSLIPTITEVLRTMGWSLCIMKVVGDEDSLGGVLLASNRYFEGQIDLEEADVLQPPSKQ